MNQYPLTHTNINREEAIIKEILSNKNCSKRNIHWKQKPPRPNVKQKRKWTTLTYFGSETGKITKLFRNTNIGIACRTRNTIKHHLRMKKNTTNRYNLSGVYQL
jgi:hypothetical protein